MSLRILDRLEEILISVLMAAAVMLIFVAVVHRFSIGFAADILKYARAHEMDGLQAFAHSAFSAINGIKLTWAQEACIFLFIWMAKFGAAYGVRTGIHVGVDILAERLEGRARQAITVIAISSGILFTAIIAWIGVDFVWHTWKGGQTSPDLEIRMWIVYLAVPLGSSLMCFRFVQALLHFLKTGELAHHDHASMEGLDEEAEDLGKGGHG